MNLFALELSEKDLLTAFLNEELTLNKYIELDNSENNLIYIINNKIAGLCSFSYSRQHSEGHIYRIDLKQIIQPSERINVPFSIPENGELELSSIEKESLIQLIESMEYSFHFYMNNAEDLLINEIQKEKNRHDKETKQINTLSIQKPTYANISEPHLRAQFLLRELGQIINMNPFIARNDQNRIFNNEFLSSGTFESIPYNKIPKDSKDIISLIDVLWFNDKTLKAAFEVELSTPFFTALLRFSDIIFNFNLPIDFYIVTTRNREKKLTKELNRAIFKKTGISQRCKVIFLDDLEHLYSLAEELKGYITPNILDKISYSSSKFLIDYESKSDFQLESDIKLNVYNY